MATKVAEVIIMSSLLHNPLPFQLSGIENFEDAKLLAKERLDTSMVVYALPG